MSFTLIYSLATTHAAMAANMDEPIKKLFSGIASWYGGKFHGRRTASGTRYDMHEMTCAHKTLPFGTKLLVKNKSNGKTCQVTVTDRGPYYGKRVIDLSKAAADKLGVDGIGQVVCYIRKAVGKGIAGAAKSIESTAKETGQTIVNLPQKIGKVARDVRENASAPACRELASASGPIDRQAFRDEIERYYKKKDFADDGEEISDWQVKGTFEPRAKTGCLLVPDAGCSGTSRHNRNVISSLDREDI